jgi:hypothetical protein
MKPFDIAQVKVGDIVKTRMEEDILILHTSKMGDLPIICLLNNNTIFTYSITGRVNSSGPDNKYDLFIPSIKKTRLDKYL